MSEIIQMDKVIDVEDMKVQMGKIVVPLNVLSNDQLHQLGNKLQELMSSIIEERGLVKTGRLRDSFFFNVVNNEKEQFISLLNDVEYLPYVLGIEFGSYSGDVTTDPQGVMREYFERGTELADNFIANSTNAQTPENSFSVNESMKILSMYRSYTGS
jgi:hypothetical protein